MTKIVSDPSINNGAPIIAGTSVKAEKVVSEVFNGNSKSDIIKRFPGITEDDIKTCIEWHRNGRPTELVESENAA